MKIKNRITGLITAFAMLIPFPPASAEAADITARLDVLSENLPVLEAYLKICERKGIDAGYEKIDYNIIKDFIGFATDDIEMGESIDIERAEYVTCVIEKMYADTEEKLKSYVTGTAIPEKTVRTSTDDMISHTGGDFTNSDGNPVFLNGFGHFNIVRGDTPRMQDFGSNLVAVEITPSEAIMSPGGINNWYVEKVGSANGSAEIADVGSTGDGSCLRLTYEDEPLANRYMLISGHVTCKPDTTYTLTFKAKSGSFASGNARFCLGGWSASKTALTPNTDWKEYKYTYTTDGVTDSIPVFFVTEGPVSEIFIDDIKVVEGDDDRNLVYNGDFEDNVMPSTERFAVNKGRVYDRIVRTLDTAAENDVDVTVLISPHHLPAWIANTYPEALYSDGSYNIKHDIIREAFDIYIKTLVEMFGDHEALNSICLANEPAFNVRNVGASEEYSAYLSRIYNNDISALNNAYNRLFFKYRDFSQVPMPSDNTYNTAFYDYVNFNDEYFAEWMKYLADTVHKYNKNIPVHIKTTSIWNYNDPGRGTDPELFAEFCDYNGCDLWAFYKSGLHSKVVWYEYLRAIKDVPVINSEDHFIEDKNEDYSPKQAVYVGADAWQGAIHGRDANAAWLWERGDKNTLYYGNIRYRPDALSEFCKASLDLNRLANEVSAVQNAEPKVSILYSKTAFSYSSSALNNISQAFLNAMYAGTNPTFITEKQLCEGKEIKGALVIPGIVQIKEDARNEIIDYISDGGTVIAVGSSCLSKNERNSSYIDSVQFAKQVTKDNLCKTLSEIVQDAFVLKDANGDMITGVDIKTAERDGVKLVNLCNYSWDETKTAVINGFAVDLISGKEYSDSVRLEPYEPVLLEIDPGIVDVQSVREESSVLISATNNTKIEREISLDVNIFDSTTGAFLGGSLGSKTLKPEEEWKYRFGGTFAFDNCDVKIKVRYNGNEYEY